MDQLRTYADNRLVQGCLYCGGLPKTREHVPSRILLSKPYPNNLPVMPACESCNSMYSLDEEYVACVLACMKAGTTKLDSLDNIKVIKALKRKPALHNMISKELAAAGGDTFTFSTDRFINIIRKLAIGHAAFELSLVFRDEPSHLNFCLTSAMSKSEWEDYDSVSITDQLGEVGCRNIQRMYVIEVSQHSPIGGDKIVPLLVNDWVEVQDDVYRYHALQSREGVQIKIVMGEYMACTVFWDC
ncbi:MAG: hypothetical protein HLUCCO02_13050 [Idiomarinaceae bacterium HL-53]|nr:MAG: hypothetical protein HLUCCO02_13050 [Idiomarinaceae bacterium HL-53]CUS47648.1 hypothetical protein Ga0003345_0581 [Idiomarinaceae bacterium HL-53]